MEIEQLVSMAATAMEAAGVLVLVLGAIGALARSTFHRCRGSSMARAYQAYREGFGRSILVALELLVAADIMRSVAGSPTLEGVLVLGLIVLIRTFLGLMLQLETEGRFPWQKGNGAEGAGARDGADGIAGLEPGVPG